MTRQFAKDDPQERPLFGWGGWSRARVFNEQGLDVSSVDGAWVGFIGKSGWVGYIGLFGLFCLPIFVLFLNRREKIDGLVVGWFFLAGIVVLLLGLTVLPMAFTYLGAGLAVGAIPISRVTLNNSRAGQAVFGLLAP